MKLSQVKTDTKKEAEGVWVPISSDGARIKVARMPNPKYDAFIRKEGKPVARQLRVNEGDAALMFEQLQKRGAAKYVLLGWDKIEADDSTEESPKYLQWSQEKALEVFNSHPEFWRIVQEEAQTLSHFKTETLEEAAGN